MNKDHYQTLRVPREASSEEIRHAYRTLAKEFHPDVINDSSQKTHFLNIQYAYDILSKPDRKEKYDSSLEELIQNPVFISIENSSGLVPKFDEIQKFYSLLTIKAESDKLVDDTIPIHVSIVLDTSTSMKGKRISLAKENIKLLLNKLRGNDIFSLVVFNDRAKTLITSSQVKDIINIDNLLNHIYTEGGTEIFQGLSRSINEFDFKTEVDIGKYIILLTDGHTYGDEERCLSIAKEAAYKGVVLDAFGFGSEWNDQFLEELAIITGGKVIFVNSEKILKKFFSEHLNKRNDLIAHSLKLNIKWDDRFKLNYVFKNNPDLMSLPLNNQYNLGNLYKNQEIELLFEFLLEPNCNTNELTTFGDGYLDIFIPIYRRVYRENIQVGFEKQIDKERNSNTKVMTNAVKNLTYYRMQERVKFDINNGEQRQASQRLRYLASHNFRNNNAELKSKLLKEADYIEQYKNFSTYGDKNIKYETRMLLAPPTESVTND